MSEWKPIESAPKDGTKILALCQPTYYETGKSMPFSYINVVWWRKRVEDDHNKWRHSLNDSVAQPTHWMPLPDAPTEGVK